MQSVAPSTTILQDFALFRSIASLFAKCSPWNCINSYHSMWFIHVYSMDHRSQHRGVFLTTVGNRSSYVVTRSPFSATKYTSSSSFLNCSCFTSDVWANPSATVGCFGSHITFFGTCKGSKVLEQNLIRSQWAQRGQFIFEWSLGFDNFKFFDPIILAFEKSFILYTYLLLILFTQHTIQLLNMSLLLAS